MGAANLSTRLMGGTYTVLLDSTVSQSVLPRQMVTVRDDFGAYAGQHA